MKEINWTKFSALSEVFSSLAIVVTLIYLAIQTQQTNEALLANSRQATMQADLEFISAVISSPEAFANLQAPIAELSIEEFLQMRNTFVGMVRIREFVWFQYQNGILDDNTFRSYMAPMSRWLQWEGAHDSWLQFKEEMDPEFVAYIDQRLEESE